MKLGEILKDIAQTVPYTEFLGIIDSEGMVVEMWTEKWKDYAETISAALSMIGGFIQDKKKNARNAFVREALQGFTELIIETEKSYLILRELEGTEYYIGAAIGKEGNLGLLRSKIKMHLNNIKKILT